MDSIQLRLGGIFAGRESSAGKGSGFPRFAGKNAKVRTRLPIEGQRNFKGKIVGVTEGRLELEVAPGKQIEIALTDIEKANLIADLSMRPQGS